LALPRDKQKFSKIFLPMGEIYLSPAGKKLKICQWVNYAHWQIFGLQGVAEALSIFFYIPNLIWNMNVEYFAVRAFDGLNVLLFMGNWCCASCE
jgi:hypothetical protein